MSWIEEYRQKQAESKRKEIEDKANDLYQICEYESALWLTYDGNLVCPCSYLNDDAVTAVNEMRKKFVERNSKRNGTI